MSYKLILLFPAMIAVIAVSYTYILTRPGQFLSGLYNWLDEIFKTDKRALHGKGPHWIFMIIIFCEKCFGGQFAFWFFLYYEWNNYVHDFYLLLLFQHIFFTLFTIMLSSIFKHKYIKHIENE